MSRGYADHLLDVYGVHLHLAWTRGGWRRMRETITSLEADPPTTAGMTRGADWIPDPRHRLSIYHPIIWVDRRQHKAEPEHQLVDTIAHEVSHVVDNILKHISEDNPASEQRAYLVGWITGWAWRKMH